LTQSDNQSPGAPFHTAQERLIHPTRDVYGSLCLPGDKSISHRFAVLGAFASVAIVHELGAE
jgi:5-enolpyruvylshikimate-3-phosphate synthase